MFTVFVLRKDKATEGMVIGFWRLAIGF